jgi:hypothetical protein
MVSATASGPLHRKSFDFKVLSMVNQGDNRRLRQIGETVETTVDTGDAARTQGIPAPLV